MDERAARVFETAYCNLIARSLEIMIAEGNTKQSRARVVKLFSGCSREEFVLIERYFASYRDIINEIEKTVPVNHGRT